jgi:hypothetical protein
LNAAFADGSISGLELMQLAADNPGLIVAGVNDYALADPFRLALIDTVTRLKDPLGTIACLDVDREPNQDISSRIAGVLAGLVDRGSVADGRAVPVIEKLLAGNPMRGEKNNLYPVLAQLAAQGEQAARALVRGADVGAFSPDSRPCSIPRARRARARSIRSRRLLAAIQQGPVERPTGPTEQRRHGRPPWVAIASLRRRRSSRRSGSTTSWAETTSWTRVCSDPPRRPTRYEFSTVRLDTGDLQLVYGAYTVKRR